jgi:hypothetical protein
MGREEYQGELFEISRGTIWDGLSAAFFEVIHADLMLADGAKKLAQVGFYAVETGLYAPESGVSPLFEAVNPLLKLFGGTLREQDSKQDGDGW